MEEQGIRYRKRKVLDMPSWTPPDMPKEDGSSESGIPVERSSRGATIYSPPVLPPTAGSAASPPEGHERPALAYVEPPPSAEAPPPNRYVLLAAFAEIGTPPPGLQTNSGLIAVALPDNSTLTGLFEAGQQYRFTSETFEGHYRVLEAYPSPQEALLIYPEGLPVDPAKGDFLHWREFDDASSANAAAWSALH
jgi:hypothetical protein